MEIKATEQQDDIVKSSMGWGEATLDGQSRKVLLKRQH